MPLRTVRSLDADETLTFRCDGCRIERSWTRDELLLVVGGGQVLHHIGLHRRLACAKCDQAPSSAWFSWQRHGG